MKYIITLVVIAFLVTMAYIPLWPKQVKMGTTYVNTFTKIQLMTGRIMID